MFKLIAELFAWSEAKDQDWRSWLMHSALALLLALLSPAGALMVYGWRELEQVAGYKRAGAKIPYFDCLMDFWAPFMTVCTAVSAALGFWWIAGGCLLLIVAGLSALERHKAWTRR